MRARYGRFQKADLEGLLNYGADTWAVKLTAATLNQGKGYSRNTAGKELDKTDTVRAGAHVLWAPTDTFTAELQYNYSDMSGSPKATLDVSTDSRDLFCGLFNYCSGVLGEPATGNRRVTLAEFTGDVGIKQHQLISEVNVDIGSDYTLTYLGGWTSFDDVWAGDSDGSPFRIVEVHRYGDYEQFSNEIRITRHSGHALTWQAGFYFFNNSSDTNHLVDTGGPVFSPYELTKASSDSQSVFGEADLHLLDDKLVFTLGGRYIRETKRLDRTVIDRSVTPNVTLLGPNAGGERTDDDVIYRAGARYQFNSDFMIYVTNSTGFRSGGFSPRASTPAIIARGFRPEKLISWEAGLRSTLLDGRATLNLTGFHMIYKDMQVEVSIPTVNLVSQISIENVGKAKFHGVELDFAIAATDFWQLSGNAGWLDSKYTKFQADLYGDGIIADETGLKLRRAPKWTAAVQSQFTFPVGEGELSWRVGYSWRDDYEETITNHPGTTTKAFGLLDSSVSYELGAWTVSAFGRNLTNEDAWTHHYVVGPVRPTAGSPNNGSLWKFAMTRPPREYGLELTYKF